MGGGVRKRGGGVNENVTPVPKYSVCSQTSAVNCLVRKRHKPEESGEYYSWTNPQLIPKHLSLEWIKNKKVHSKFSIRNVKRTCETLNYFYLVGMCTAAEMETCEVSTLTVNQRLCDNWSAIPNAGTGISAVYYFKLSI